MKGKVKAASAAQVAQFGHVAAVIRQAMDAKGMTVRELNLALKANEAWSAPYVWRTAKGAPGPKTRPKLAKILGVSEADLTPNEEHEIRASSSLSALKPSIRVLTGSAVPPLRLTDVLNFSITSDGKARVKLDVQLDLDRATPLLRMLLDQNLVIQQTHEDKTLAFESVDATEDMGAK